MNPTWIATASQAEHGHELAETIIDILLTAQLQESRPSYDTLLNIVIGVIDAVSIYNRHYEKSLTIEEISETLELTE
jgi:hypothetical protein